MKCGIKKYDKLPSRVGVVDVDYLRFKLTEITQMLESIVERNRKSDDASEEHEYNINIGIEDFQHAIGRMPKDKEEYERFVHYCFKGVESQLDWDIIYNCAKEEIDRHKS